MIKQKQRLNIDEIFNKKKEMTYILGSRCKDGVVLIGDRKVTLGTDSNYEDKVFMDIYPIVIGSSGVSGLFEKFRNRVKAYSMGHQNVDIETFISEIENITRVLNESYRERLQGSTFDVLIGIKALEGGAVLQYIYPIGFSEPVRKYRAIGHGEPYVSIFLKQLWTPDMSMKEVAELGYFAIKYIEAFELDSSVGVGNHKPQIWFIPDNAPKEATEEEKKQYEPHQADQQFLEELENKTITRLEKYKKSIKEDFNI